MRPINRYIPIRIQNYFYEKKEALLNQEDLIKWESAGRPVPPPHAEKQRIIKKNAKIYGCRVLIETGTYLGDTIFSQKAGFDRIISIELSKRLYRAAKRRFRKYPNIEIYNGDSGELLPGIMKENKSRALLWLDGHFSGGLTARGATESPVFRELEAIFSNNRMLHVILIDDARLFTGERDYPTMDELIAFVTKKNPHYTVVTESDIIALLPDSIKSDLKPQITNE